MPVPPHLANLFRNLLLQRLGALEAEADPPSKFTGFNRESIDNIEVVERFIPTSTLYLFLDFVFEGQLFSGRKTSSPLITEEEVPLCVKDYAQWAPAPWNGRSMSLDQRMLGGPESFDVYVPRKLSCMRARLWEGMVPMTGARWKEKKLDDPKNWQCAFEFIFDVVKVFVWLGDPEISRGIKDQFNYIAEELDTFQNALNARREAAGVTARVDLKALWLEFITDIFETMVFRTYHWVVDRINEIQSKGKEEYEAVADAKGAINAHAEAKAFLASWADLNHVRSYADFAIMMPLDGFTGFPAPNRTYSKVVGSMFPMPFRQDEGKEMQMKLNWQVSERILEDPEALHRNRDDINALLQETAQNQELLRRQQRGERKVIGREHWIAILHSRTEWSLSHGGPRDQKWGFVVYMLTHRPSPDEWEQFRTKLYADFARAGDWVEGFEEIVDNMDVQFIDGKQSGLPHDDVEAAKRHFKIFAQAGPMRRRTWKQDFFVVDTASYDSYMNPPTAFQNRSPYGDYGGFLTLIDTTMSNPQVIREQAPGYQNKLRVLGTMVFDDVYPLLASLAQRPRDLWTLAMRHPNQVYVGPAVATQEADWDIIWNLRWIWWICFWNRGTWQPGSDPSNAL